MMPSLWVSVWKPSRLSRHQPGTHRHQRRRRAAFEYGSVWVIRGRVGYAFGRFMPYVTAGFGFVDVENAGGNPANANRYLTISEWRPGFVVGAGAEYAFSQNLIARLEYLYFDTKSYEVRNLENEMMKFDNNIHLVRAGPSISFRQFPGGRAGPGTCAVRAGSVFSCGRIGDEGHELGKGETLGEEGVDRGVGVGKAERHAADQHFGCWDAGELLHRLGIAGEGGLRAGFQSFAAGRQHDRLNEHAHVEPAALFHVAIDREDQADGRVEERIVAPVLGVHARLVVAADAEHLVEPEAAGAAAREIGFAPADGIVVVFSTGGRAGVVQGWSVREPSAVLASPVSTRTFQGWMLEPEGARPAMVRIFSIVVRGTSLGRNSRMLRRPVMASSTVIMSRPDPFVTGTS